MTILVLGLYMYELDFDFKGNYNTDTYIHTRASTFTFATLSIIQLFNSFGTRSERHSILGKEFIANTKGY